MLESIAASRSNQTEAKPNLAGAVSAAAVAPAAAAPGPCLAADTGSFLDESVPMGKKSELNPADVKRVALARNVSRISFILFQPN